MTPRTAERQGEYAIYARLSKAPDGSLEKVERQERTCRELATDRALPVGDVFVDNNLSAWKPNRSRPGWDRLLAEIATGKWAGIITVHGDRLMRHPDDCGALIRASDAGGGIIVASPRGDHDLRDDFAKTVLWQATVMAWSEVAATSRRVRSKINDDRRNGKPGGPPQVFGYTHVTEPNGPGQRRIVSWTVNPEQAAIIRDIAARVVGGESWASIARDLTARQVRKSRGGTQWSTSMVSAMVLRDRHGGITRYRDLHDREHIAAIPRPDGMPDGEPWPILDPDTFERLHAMAASAARGPRRTDKTLLSGIAVCGRCGGVFNAGSRAKSGEPCYKCKDCYVTATASFVDDLCEEAVLRWYEVRAPELAANAGVMDAELMKAKASVDLLTDNIAGFIAKLSELGKPMREIESSAAMRQMERALSRAQAHVASIDTPERTAAHWARNARDEWTHGDVHARRRLVTTAIRSLTIMPTTLRRGFDFDRVKLVMR